VPEQNPRDITDPRALRAIAHPLRLRILEAIAFSGPATATEVAELVGESPANCSWHLRQLAKYGFLVEAGGGTGRQRPWRLVTDGHQWGDGEESPELARAGDAAADVLLEHEYRALRDWMRTRRREPAAWREAGFWNQSMGWATADELVELQDELRRLFMRYQSRLDDPASRPAGSRPIRLIGWAVPALFGDQSASREDPDA
jgi:predicted ArsR family transcriptional regulator